MSKTALVTGGSRGIGAETAKVLAGTGHRVYIGYLRKREKAEAVAREVSGTACCFDVSNPEKVRASLREIGDIDVLVNNAGASQYGLLSDISDSELVRVIGVNLTGAALCAREAVPGMVRRKSGVIINVSSVWGRVGASCEAAYSAAKAGLVGLTLALAKELGPSGIRVNCVCPGVIDTDMLSDFDMRDKQELTEKTPLGRLGRPSDVAELIAFLASEKAGFITGQIIGVDGGFTG